MTADNQRPVRDEDDSLVAHVCMVHACTFKIQYPSRVSEAGEAFMRDHERTHVVIVHR